MQSLNESTTPWYKEFWAWFVFTPLIIVVISSSVMVSIAFHGKEDVVDDDYYKVGKMINQGFAPSDNAKALGLIASVAFDSEGKDVFVSLNQTSWKTEKSLLLHLSHPAKADQDHFITLIQYDDLKWKADVSSILYQGRWYLRLSSLSDDGGEVWRLQGEIDFAERSSERSVVQLQ